MNMPVKVSAAHQVVAVPEDATLVGMFAGAKRVMLDNKPWLALAHDPVTTLVLRRLGYDAPSPIMHYKWPGLMHPFKVQRETVSHLVMNQRAYCLNDMGTGKTKAALWGWDYLYSLGLTGKLIIFAPLSTLQVVWAAEVLETIPHRTCTVLHGVRAKRLALLERNIECDIYIVNHDGYKVLAEELAKRKDINHVIIDELAIYRNYGSPRSKAMAAYCKGKQWVWGMTGSPMPTLPTDVFAQAKIVTPNTVPKYFKGFREELMLRVSEFKWVAKSNAIDKAFAALQPAVRYSIDDVVELPPVIERFLDVPMGAKQAAIYKELHKKAITLVQEGVVTAANAGGIMSKLMQIACGWVYTTTGKIATLDNDARLQAALDVIESTSNKILIFATFKHATAGIALALKAAGYDDFAVVTGDTPAGARDEIFTLFQKTGKYRIMVAHPQCLAHGVTLTAADTILWFNPTTNLETYEQANRRIRRVGQKHKQQIVHFQGAPIERHCYQLLDTKQVAQVSLLDLFKAQTAA